MQLTNEKIKELREKYQTVNLKTYEEMNKLHLKIGDRKFYAILNADQIVFYRKEYYRLLEENAATGDF